MRIKSKRRLFSFSQMNRVACVIEFVLTVGVLPDGACNQDGRCLYLVCGHHADHPLKCAYDHHLLPVFKIGEMLCECFLEQRRQVFDNILTLVCKKKTDSPPVIFSFFLAMYPRLSRRLVISVTVA